MAGAQAMQVFVQHRVLTNAELNVTYPGHRLFQDIPGVSAQSWLWVTVVISLVYSLMALAIRVVLKRKCWGCCDWLLIVAYVFYFVIHGCTWDALLRGFGKAVGYVDQAEYLKISELVFTGKILFWLVLGFSKLSVLFFVRSMVPRDMQLQWRAIHLAIGLVAFLTIAAPVFTAIACLPSTSLDGKYAGSCKGITHFHRLLVLASIDITAEMVVTFLPIWICLSIQLSRAHQALVIMGFGIRLTVAPFCVYYFYTMFDFLKGGESNIGLVPNLIWQQAFMSYSLILATAPCLRTFVKRFRTGGVRNIVGARPRRPSPRLAGCVEMVDHSAAAATRGTDSAAATRSASVAGLLKPESIAASARSLMSSGSGVLERFGGWSVMRHDRQSARLSKSKHWSQVFGGPLSNVASGDAGSADGIWDLIEERPEGWEKARAEELLTAPHRLSVQTLDFITMADF